MKFYAWFLALYPRRFRERFAAGMQSAVSADYARARRRGRWAALVFLTVTGLQALWFGIAERLPRRSTVASFLSTDVRDAVRSLRATPLATAIGVLSLALGIGANTALFSILNTLVLRELPVRDPQRLVIVDGTDWSNPIWEQIRARQDQLFESAGAWSIERFDLAGSGRTDLVTGAYVSGGLFHTLGVETALGRPLAAADDDRGGGPDGPVVVISHRLWQQRFGGSSDAIGRSLTVGGIPFTIVGVAPSRFLGPEVGEAVDLFLPLGAEAAIRGPETALDRRDSFWLKVMARLRPDQSIAAATAAVDAVRPAILEAAIPLAWTPEYRADFRRTPIALTPASNGVSGLRDRFEQPLVIILMVVGAVLLIACANIANLLLARATARRHEMSVRVALGASRMRLACQLLVESLMLAFAGGLAALVVARTGAELLVRQLGSEVTTVTLDLSLDWRVLAFTAAVSLGATLLFGLAPAFGVRSVEPNAALKEQGRTVVGSRRAGLRHALVVAQVALSFVLIAGAGLFVRTFAALQAIPLGFDPGRLLIVNVDARRSTLAREELDAVAERMSEVTRAVPGVARSSLSYLTPLSGRNWTHRVEVTGGPTLTRQQQTAWVNAVAPGWFETYGMRLIAGRDIASSDLANREPVGVVNEAFVKRFVGSRNPVGLTIRGVGLGRLDDTTIVGVVNDAVYRTARVGVVPTMYLPMAQANRFGAAFSITAKLAGDRFEVERQIAAALGGSAPAFSFSFRNYEDQVRATLIQERLVAMLSGFFGVLALMLSALGLYGVTSYAVSRQRPELAIRMALGASGSGVVRLVLRRVAILIASGGGLGLGLSLWAARFVEPLLFRVGQHDPATLATAAVVLAAVGLAAGWLPARTVARLDPSATLRG